MSVWAFARDLNCSPSVPVVPNTELPGEGPDSLRTRGPDADTLLKFCTGLGSVDADPHKKGKRRRKRQEAVARHVSAR